MKKIKYYGTNCSVCGEPLKEPQILEHTDDGLAHAKCLTPSTPPPAATPETKSSQDRAGHSSVPQGDRAELNARAGMTNEQLRELDAWIAENVTNWKPSADDGICWDENDDPIIVVPHYTTAPAAAMEVLKKCAEKCWHPSKSGGGISDILEITYSDDSFSFGFRIPNNIEAPTLELAVCLFAKKLFSTK